MRRWDDGTPGPHADRTATLPVWLRLPVSEENRDLVWLRLSRLGCDWLRQDRPRLSLRAFQRTAVLTGHFRPGDPRQAASLNNCAVARAAVDGPSAGVEPCLEAARAWGRTGDEWLAGMHLARRTGHPLFHDRVADPNQPAVNAARHPSQRRDLRLARAITTLNRAAFLADAFGSDEIAWPGASSAGRSEQERLPAGLEAARQVWAARISARRPAGIPDTPVHWGRITEASPARAPAASDEARLDWALYWTLLAFGGIERSTRGDPANACSGRA